MLIISSGVTLPHGRLYLITYHFGLFIALTFAQIGIQGSKQGYFPRN